MNEIVALKGSKPVVGCVPGRSALPRCPPIHFCSVKIFVRRWPFGNDLIDVDKLVQVQQGAAEFREVALLEQGGAGAQFGLVGRTLQGRGESELSLFRGVRSRLAFDT